MAGKKILVVDDEEESLALVEQKLSSEGYEVATAVTAGEAMDRAGVFMPDLILIDIVLPDMDGSDAVRALSEDPVTAGIPVIFLTGIVAREGEKGVSEVRVGGRLYKAMGKPFSLRELVAQVKKTIG